MIVFVPLLVKAMHHFFVHYKNEFQHIKINLNIALKKHLQKPVN